MKSILSPFNGNSNSFTKACNSRPINSFTYGRVLEIPQSISRVLSRYTNKAANGYLFSDAVNIFSTSADTSLIDLAAHRAKSYYLYRFGLSLLTFFIVVENSVLLSGLQKQYPL